MIDDTRRSEREAEDNEPVFGSEENAAGEIDLDTLTDSSETLHDKEEPEFSAASDTFPATNLEGTEGLDEPVFGTDGPSDQSQGVGTRADDNESDLEPYDQESDHAFTFSATYDEETAAANSFQDVVETAEYDSETASETGTTWVQMPPDSDTDEDPFNEREYDFFEETPAAELADSTPPTRKLGRTGPVWVIGGIALLLIIGLAWLGVSRLTGTDEEVAAVSSEPTVQQLAAESPTPAPPTSTPGPTPTDSPIQLPINANVTVGDTGGQGVKMRAGPGLDGELVEIIEEGTTMVVLANEPGSQYSEYPVEKDGYLWYRMRVPGMADAENNPIVGWCASDFFVVDVP